MVFPLLVGMMLAVPQESVVPPAPRIPLPRPVADAPLAQVNDNRVPAGRFSGDTLVLALDVVEAAWQPEGAHDPVVRVLAFAEPGKAPVIPGPMMLEVWIERGQRIAVPVEIVARSGATP